MGGRERMGGRQEKWVRNFQQTKKKEKLNNNKKKKKRRKKPPLMADVVPMGLRR